VKVIDVQFGVADGSASPFHSPSSIVAFKPGPKLISVPATPVANTRSFHCERRTSVVLYW